MNSVSNENPVSYYAAVTPIDVPLDYERDDSEYTKYRDEWFLVLHATDPNGPGSSFLEAQQTYNKISNHIQSMLVEIQWKNNNTKVDIMEFVELERVDTMELLFEKSFSETACEVLA